MPAAASRPALRTVLGQPSWSFRSNRVRAHLTRLGGHLGPVAFSVGGRWIEPFSVAPWAAEKLEGGVPSMLRALRGDFFCAPFGANERPWRGEAHPPHGETANAVWRLRSIERGKGRTVLRAALTARVRPGRVEKEVTLVDGHAALYQRHSLSGYRGPLPVGHHPMLRFPEAEGSGLISTSRTERIQVFPGWFERPEKGGYQALRPGGVFRSLNRAPLLNGGTTDISRFPARAGFEDLVMLTADPSLAFAWTAVVFPAERYAWLAIRRPIDLPHTIFWISNGGRRYPPWNGRHRAVMGLEDVASYFHTGLEGSAGKNPLRRLGYPTMHVLDPRRPTEIRHVMVVAALPAGFDRVRGVRAQAGEIELVAENGRRARCAADLRFLEGNEPE